MIRYIFGASFKTFSLSFPDVNRNTGVAETAPLSSGEVRRLKQLVRQFVFRATCLRSLTRTVGNLDSLERLSFKRTKGADLLSLNRFRFFGLSIYLFDLI